MLINHASGKGEEIYHKFWITKALPSTYTKNK